MITARTTAHIWLYFDRAVVVVEGATDASFVTEPTTMLVTGADEAALDTWAADRHKIAEDVVALKDRMTRMATLQSSAGRALSNIAIGFAGHIPAFGRALARNVAELNNRGRSRQSLRAERLEK
jgi:hypothetical protein